MKLSTCMHDFFDQYLPRMTGASIETIKAYREAFTLFLSFAAKYLFVKPAKLEVTHLTLKLVLDFLEHLEVERNNCIKTRNVRLAALKSFAKMLRLMHPEYHKVSEIILNIPLKRFQKTLIGYLTHGEFRKVVESVDLKKKDGFRDYTILHLLYDSGARASEVAGLKLDYFNLSQKTLSILGKGNRYRQIELWPITTKIIELYIKHYRPTPKPLYNNYLFINQRREAFTRHGINRLCKKYLLKALGTERLKNLSPAHSFRHSCAINMLSTGHSVDEIKNHLGHEKLDSTMVYLKLNLTRKREVQKVFIKFTKSLLTDDPKINEMLDWDNKEKTLTWLDTL
ncbi:MAG: tyrosine-type recombinase/integrase [Planctomycetes bacterium]|nr:tyrosine-type recombinase/integrase [Planctomycetota bacterium]